MGFAYSFLRNLEEYKVSIFYSTNIFLYKVLGQNLVI